GCRATRPPRWRATARWSRPWSPGPSTAPRSSPPSRTARSPPPSSTPRSPATPAPSCCATGSPPWTDEEEPMSTPRLELLPAVDVVDGQAVRLFQGAAGSETTYGDPAEAAGAWVAEGAEWIHLVDLDAAFGRGSNHELLARIVAELD